VINQAFFYMHIQPMLIFYLLLNLSIFYLVNRHLVLRSCKMPDLVAPSTFQHTIRSALNVPLIYMCGSLTFLVARKNWNWIDYVPAVACFGVWAARGVVWEGVERGVGWGSRGRDR
jgi:hypothetical protein